MILATTERSAGIITLFIIVWEIFDLRWFVLEKNEIVIERVFTQEELTFERRILIYERACSSLPLIQDVLKSNDTSFETLINLHAAVLDVNAPLPEVKQAKCIPNNIIKSSVFNLTESMDLMICLPPKCGTSNWQQALDVHYLNVTKGNDAAVNLQKMFEEGTGGWETYNTLPRMSPKKIFHYTKNNRNAKEIIDSTNRVANVRNPFARIYSGWDDKMRNEKLRIQYFGRYYQGAKPFQKLYGKIPDGYRVSFEPFVEYLASNPGDSRSNEHWMTAFNLCSACAMNYTIITHLENSREEIQPLLESIDLQNLEIGHQYNWENDKRVESETIRPPDELHWRNVPRETAKLIYKHFFLDFVVFGYTTDESSVMMFSGKVIISSR
jgi:hypothetical protein